MPIINCPCCKKETNTVYLRPLLDEVSGKCLAHLDDNREYVEGCGFSGASEDDKDFARRMGVKKSLHKKTI